MLAPTKSRCFSAMADVGILADTALKFIYKIRPKLNRYDIFGFEESGNFEIVGETNF
jgi:hypothetical protein